MMRFLPYVPAGAHHERSAIICAANIICRRQKSFKKRTLSLDKSAFFVARQKGLEPPTFWFVAKHSIQLSYWRILKLPVYVNTAVMKNQLPGGSNFTPPASGFSSMKAAISLNSLSRCFNPVQ